jgi:hypothetical protein
LAATTAVGISTWRACAAALWLASVEVTAASTYDFHATVRNYFAILTRPFHIPNTSIYISFRVAQDHNKAAGRDTTSSTTSSTRWEDPVATT